MESFCKRPILIENTFKKTGWERNFDVVKKFEKVFYSEFLNKNFDYYLLTSDDTVNAYVLYMQDGKDYLELGGLENTVENIIESYPELAKKLVFVLIHPGDSLERWHSYHHSGNNFCMYIQFMNDEFIPEIEDSLKRNVVKRGILGSSLGGNVSLNIAIKEPSNWTHLLLQSAAISKKDIAVINNVATLNWNIYQTVGIDEEQFVSPITKENLYILTRNRELYHTFLKQEATVQYKEQKERHEWAFWEKDLTSVLDFFINTP